jgi:DNA-binding response OmpR family regulator
MANSCVLIVDDEANIRFTLSQALAALPLAVETAAGGEEALRIVEEQAIDLILLDLRMPGLDGMEVLRRLRDARPEIPIVIITAHGTVGSAIEAMKLGAIEFLQKPFSPDQIRQVVSQVLQRQALNEADAHDYATHFLLAKRCLSERHADAAMAHLKKAIALAPDRPEAFNLLGAIHELRGELSEALNNYRAAWAFDATYQPASKNIERAASSHRHRQPIDFGDLREPTRPEQNGVNGESEAPDGR